MGVTFGTGVAQKGLCRVSRRDGVQWGLSSYNYLGSSVQSWEKGAKRSPASRVLGKDGCAPKFVLTNAAQTAAASLHPTTLHLEAKAPDPKLADSRGTGGPELSPGCAVPLALCKHFCLVLVLLHKKIPPRSQTAPKRGEQQSCPAAHKPLVLRGAASPTTRQRGSHLRVSGNSEGPVGEELLQLPGNGECKDLVRRQEGAQGFAAQVLE